MAVLRINSTCSVARAQEAVTGRPVLQPSAKGSAEGAKRAPGWPTLPPSQDFPGLEAATYGKGGAG